MKRDMKAVVRIDVPEHQIGKDVTVYFRDTSKRRGICVAERASAAREIEGGGSTWWYVCSECHTAVDEHDRYCRQCGRAFDL